MNRRRGRRGEGGIGWEEFNGGRGNFKREKLRRAKCVKDGEGYVLEGKRNLRRRSMSVGLLGKGKHAGNWDYAYGD